MTISIALIADIHHGPDHGLKLGTQAERLFGKFREWVNREKPDYLIDLGDRITDIDPEIDFVREAEVGRWFETIPVPRAHLLGNHDVRFLQPEQNAVALGLDISSTIKEIDGVSLICWNPCSRLDPELGAVLQTADLEWLANALTKTQYPTVIFSHIPFDGGTLVGNHYFENDASFGAYQPEQARSARNIIEQSGVVTLCINAHTHWNTYHCVSGIHFVTIPSLTESFPTMPKACESWARLKYGRSIDLRVYGNLPARYALKPRTRKSPRWIVRGA